MGNSHVINTIVSERAKITGLIEVEKQQPNRAALARPDCSGLMSKAARLRKAVA
jgi:hypothetical protein